MKRTIPDLQFTLDKEFDYWTCKEFLNYDNSDMFSNSILKDHPELSKFKSQREEEREKSINKYIDKYYEDHEKEISDIVEKTEKEWGRIKTQFFYLVDKVFYGDSGSYTWLDGHYICALSVFNCNPRFIEDKDFQAYYKHAEGVLYVCVHEMLHFAFYDYVKREDSKIFQNLKPNEMWKLSEIFNDVVLRTPDFVKLTKNPNPTIYAHSEEELKKYKKMWLESKDTDDFLKHCYDLVNRR